MPYAEKTTKNRITALDVYRIIACLQVFINHNNSKLIAQTEPKSAAWLLTVAIVYITKIAVPGFFMITGYNLVHREDSWAREWQRIKRILADLLVFSLIYYIYKCAAGDIVISAGSSFPASAWNYIWGFISIVWTSPMTEAFWYLYAYLGILLILPFLQKMAVHMDKKDVDIFLLLGLVFVCTLPAIEVFLPGAALSVNFSLPVVGAAFGSVFYIMAGHRFYIINAEKKAGYNEAQTPAAWVLIAGMLAGFAANMLLSLKEFSMTGGESFLSMSDISYLPLAMESICLFALLLRIKYPVKIAETVEKIAPLTFGVYLVTDMFCTWTHMIYYNLCPYMNRLLAAAVQDIAAIAGAFAFVLLLRLIKPVRKWL